MLCSNERYRIELALIISLTGIIGNRLKDLLEVRFEDIEFI